MEITDKDYEHWKTCGRIKRCQKCFVIWRKSMEVG